MIDTNSEVYLKSLILSLYNWLEPAAGGLHSSCKLDSGYDYVECNCGLDDLLAEVQQVLGLNNEAYIEEN